jgi:coenzyme F420-reducing hydrogenase delta subunit
VLHAISGGFDGVFLAADGEECAYLPDCAERVARNSAAAQQLLRDAGLDPRRLKMAAICSVCADPFTSHMREFSELLVGLGPVAASGAPASGAPASGAPAGAGGSDGSVRREAA